MDATRSLSLILDRQQRYLAQLEGVASEHRELLPFVASMRAHLEREQGALFPLIRDAPGLARTAVELLKAEHAALQRALEGVVEPLPADEALVALVEETSALFAHEDEALFGPTLAGKGRPRRWVPDHLRDVS